jgi:hypothetical protein
VVVAVVVVKSICDVLFFYHVEAINLRVEKCNYMYTLLLMLIFMTHSAEEQG